MTELKNRIGFIGAGNMGEAICGAIIKSGIIDSSMIHAYDLNNERLEYLKQTYDINISHDIKGLLSLCDVVILAVKPQTMDGVLEELAPVDELSLQTRKIIISIAAGIPLQRFEKAFYNGLAPEKARQLPLIRVMPNTPSLVLEGMSGLCANQHATGKDIETATTILESMGKVITFNEEEMDAVTAISGSGPAYFFYFIESMIKAGTDLGLSEEKALTLAATTMKGAAKLLEESGEPPETLRRKVTSPGGTTEAALKVMEENHIKDDIIKAVKKAALRSKELVNS